MASFPSLGLRTTMWVMSGYLSAESFRVRYAWAISPLSDGYTKTGMTSEMGFTEGGVVVAGVVVVVVVLRPENSDSNS